MFIGRTDSQIKFLGHRIELGEIEAALSALDDIDEAVVVYNYATETSEQAIGALVSSSAGMDIAQIGEKLRNCLPQYMVPTVIMLEDGSFPQTPNGKYDRKSIQKLVFAK